MKCLVTKVSWVSGWHMNFLSERKVDIFYVSFLNKSILVEFEMSYLKIVLLRLKKSEGRG